jgi:hypothetical protein
MKNTNLNKLKSIIWAIVLTISCSLLTIFSATYVKNIKKNRDNKIEQTISVNKNDDFASTNDSVRNLVNELEPEEVKTGIFLDRVSNFDILQSKWQYEYYQWFKWNPKKIDFTNLQELKKGIISIQSAPIQIVNGEIEKIEITGFLINDAGDSAYVNYFIKASSSNLIDVSDFPLDKQLLLINVEHKGLDVSELKFITDSSSTHISPRVSINSYMIGNVYNLSKINTYKTDFGYKSEDEFASSYSQYRFGLLLKRDGYNYYFKLLIILIIILSISFLSFFASDNDKIRIVTGCLFATTASYYFYGSKIPPTSKITILELVYAISLITIFIITLQETVLKSIIGKNDKLYNSIKWITFIITILFFICFNYLIPSLLS